MHSLLSVLVVAVSVSAALLIVIWKLVPADLLAAAVTARSNHQTPTRQLGGFAVVPAVLVALIWVSAQGTIELSAAIFLSAAALLLLLTGAIDDARNLSPAAKFVLQLTAASVATFGLHQYFPVFALGVVPVASIAMTVIILVWAINLTNFMDGIDLIVVAGIGAPALILGLGGLAGMIDTGFPTMLALALGAALAPFAVTNRPPASLFLGDNGSLPIGLFAGVVGLGLSARYSVFVGLLPFAYFIVDSSATLLRRLFKRKNIFTAHSEHAYQLASRGGVSPLIISMKVAAVSSTTTVLAILVASQMLHPVAGFAMGYAVAIALFVALKWGK